MRFRVKYSESTDLGNAYVRRLCTNQWYVQRYAHRRPQRGAIVIFIMSVWGEQFDQHLTDRWCSSVKPIPRSSPISIKLLFTVSRIMYKILRTSVARSFTHFYNNRIGSPTSVESTPRVIPVWQMYRIVNRRSAVKM
jgi:hypothetical protein